MSITLIAEILSSLAIILPLFYQFLKATKEASQAKDWIKIVSFVSSYMEEAEKLLYDGAQKKEYVIAMIKVTAAKLNYQITETNEAELRDLIDKLTAMSKVVNAGEESNEEVTETSEEKATIKTK